MNKIFYVNVIFNSGCSLCKTFMDISDACNDFDVWQECDSVLEVTLETKSILASYEREVYEYED